MDESPEPATRSQGTRRYLSRTRWWLAGMALALAALLGLAWFERRQIAGSYIDDALTERGVVARYTIADLGPGQQRLTDVVIGDPVRPDLTADWVETTTRLGWRGPEVTAIRAGRVRLRGRLVDGRLSLGELDRLLPKPSGAPFALPDLMLAIADGRMRLDTPAGPIGLKLAGSGWLQGGFAGRLAAVAPRLALRGCTLSGASAYGRVSVARGGAPAFAGPVRVASGACGSIGAAGLVAGLELRLGAALDRWRGGASIDLARAAGPGFAVGTSGASIEFAGDASATRGRLNVGGEALRAGGAKAARWQLEGPYRIDNGGATTRTMFAGEAALLDLAAPPAWRERLRGLRGIGAGTPFGPLAARLLAGIERGAASSMTTADLRLTLDTGGDWAARVARATVNLGDGGFAGTIDLAGGRGVEAGPRGTTIDGTLRLSGGDLPQGRIALAQPAPGAPLTGTATFAPYRAGDATLALTPITFRATPAGNTAFSTRVSVSGPLGDGRIEAATLPLDGGWDGRGRLVLNSRCEAASFARLSIAGLRLEPARIALCPVGRALVTYDGGRLGGGARIAAPRLTGTLGGSPLTLAARGSELRFGDGGLRIDGLAAQLGQGATPSRLAVATLTGQVAGGGIAGRYAGAGGQVGAVPLLMSDAAGGWRLSDGVLSLDGGLTVADAQTAAPRFDPLPVRDVAFRLADGRIAAGGQLRGPDGAARVADLTLTHQLSSGTGEARIAVPRVTFGSSLQPRQLTPLVIGVIADVRGTVAGEGVIRWTPQGVTSNGTFGTSNMDLAAAFGPVTGLSTQIRFTDLLALESAPDQVATVASINPGVAVEGGEIRYQLLAGPRIRVNGARWPFAGGTLALEPTLLDYSSPVDKRLTFRIDGLDAAVFLQRFDYKNLTATGVFDGTLPMIFAEDGGRIENGRLKARGGGTLAYVGEVSQENLGTWGNLAFGALKSLRYRELDLTLNGPLAGEIVTHARFGGVAQGAGAKSNFLIRRLAKLPFVFNITITAPFRSLLDTARSFYDPSLLIQRNLPTLIEEQKRAVRPVPGQARPIQPGASGAVPQQKQD